MKANHVSTLALVLLLWLSPGGNVKVRAADSLASRGTAVASVDAAIVLKTLRREHPRLVVDADGLARFKSALATNATLQAAQARIVQEGVGLLNAPISKYEIPDGLRLLSVSRAVLQRSYVLAWLARTEPDPKWQNRLWSEMEAAAGFPDWNPRHFLDTAEMTHAFAIAYDWLYSSWTAEQRGLLREAILGKGIRPATTIMQQRTGWSRARHNWNQVCNGGIGMGLLALADETPEVSAPLLASAIESIQLPMGEFAPDGAWAEGPGYWSYATSYNVVFLAALDSALGTDFGLSGTPGFSETGLFPVYLTGPLGRTFNYADGGDSYIRAPQLFWLASRFNQPACALYELKTRKPHPLDLYWGSASQRGIDAHADMPLDKHFRRADVVTFRSRWDDPDAVFVGFKGGDNKANHSNLDLGSFVLDALGVRWALDLGADDYNLPGYFGKQRWTYYRMRAEGHNTLCINPQTDPDQSPSAAAIIVKFESKPARAFAIADLTSAYAGRADKVQRGIALLDRRRVLVQDEIVPTKSADAWWFFHTRASIELAANGEARLRENGRELRAVLLAPKGGSFEVLDAAPLPTSPKPEKQDPNKGIRKLAVHLQATEPTRIAVLLIPVQTAGDEAARAIGSPPALIPLGDW